jgi:hypothetical protein
MTAVQVCMTRISVIKSIIHYSSEESVTQSHKDTKSRHLILKYCPFFLLGLWMLLSSYVHFDRARVYNYYNLPSSLWYTHLSV